MTPEEYQSRAERSVSETAETPDFAYTGEAPIGETWAMTMSRNRDSGHLENSNYESIRDDMKRRFPKDVSDERFSHWAVGWTDSLLVRMLDESGRVTEAGKAILDWQEKLDDYPVADEEDLAEKEFEGSIENIRFEGGVDKETAEDVLRWLSENKPDAIRSDDAGSHWASKADIQEAVMALRMAGELPPAEDAAAHVAIRSADGAMEFVGILADGTSEPFFRFGAAVDVDPLDLEEFKGLDAEEAERLFRQRTGAETW